MAVYGLKSRGSEWRKFVAPQPVGGLFDLGGDELTLDGKEATMLPPPGCTVRNGTVICPGKSYVSNLSMLTSSFNNGVAFQKFRET